MKKIISIIILLFVSLCGYAQGTMEGVVKDKETGELIPGVAIYIPDLRTGVVTDINGHYTLTGLPARKLLVQVKFLGYATITQQIDFAVMEKKDFVLSTSALEANEVVVTGSAFTTDNARSSMAVVPVDRKQLLTTGAANITDALAKIPGVAGISTGAAISKPVIRGLGYNRIVTINDGLRQEGQQWGDEHGLEIDQFSADRIEILKGPSSLLYGSDALGGVINILEPIPTPSGKVKAEFNSQYSTNNAMFTNSLMGEGNNKSIVWRLRGTYKDAASYASPNERIYNSGFNERDMNALLGVNKSWGFSHFHLSTYDAKLGLVEGNRDSLSGHFLNDGGEVVSNASAYTRKLDVPFQHINHLKISSVSSVFIGRGNLRFTGGWQQNDRREFASSSTQPGLYFQLNTFSGDAKYYFPEIKNVETVIGLSSMMQENKNKGIEFLIPDYHLHDVGGFISLKKNFEKATFNIGGRYDHREVTGDKLVVDQDILFKSFKSSFAAVSGSLGATYELTKNLNLKTNIGRGFRAPNISELSANGVHEGTFRYEIGNPNLHPETSLQFDLGVSYKTKKIDTELSGYYNTIDNFIYYRNTNNETILKNGINYPVYRYVQGNSVLKGFELNVDVHPVDRVHFENAISYVQGTNLETNTPLPFIPPFHYHSEISYHFKNSSDSRIRESMVNVFADIYAAQNKIDAFETSTKGASVFGLSLNSDVKCQNQWLNIFIRCSNISNANYYDHLSRLKEVGIHAMGRNITFGVTVPFGIKN